MGRIFPILFFISLALPSPSPGAQPTDVLKSAVDEVLTILDDPTYQEASRRDAQQKRIWDIIEQIFDFDEMARSTLAINWKNFTGPQKREFSKIFGQFLGKNYLDKIQTGFKGEKVSYSGYEMVTDRKAMVHTKIIRENGEIPVDYSMMILDGVWRVYDVKIEGVSLIKNYRAQFRSILLKESPDSLIEMLKKKVKEQQ